MGEQQLLHHPLRVGRRPVAGLRRHQSQAGILLDLVGEALGALGFDGVAVGALDLEDLGGAAGGLVHRVGGALALQGEIRTDEGQVVLAGRAGGLPVDGDDRDVLRRGLGEGGLQPGGVQRRDDDRLRTLRDHALDVGDLLGLAVVGVGVEQASDLGGRRGRLDGPCLLGAERVLLVLGLGEADHHAGQAGVAGARIGAALAGLRLHHAGDAGILRQRSGRQRQQTERQRGRRRQTCVPSSCPRNHDFHPPLTGFETRSVHAFGRSAGA